VTEARFLPANGADLGHRSGSVADGPFGHTAAVSIPVLLIVLAVSAALIYAFIFALELAGTPVF
jgi:hypothetical protein